MHTSHYSRLEKPTLPLATEERQPRKKHTGTYYSTEYDEAVTVPYMRRMEESRSKEAFLRAKSILDVASVVLVQLVLSYLYIHTTPLRAECTSKYVRRARGKK